MSEDTHADEELADRLGTTLDGLHRDIARNWRQVPLADDSDWSWYIAGDPPQIMVGVADGVARLTQPSGDWANVAELRYTPKRPTEVRTSESRHLSAVRDDLLRRRRSTFRYCTSCLRITAPELRVEEVCMDCAAADGTVF